MTRKIVTLAGDGIGPEIVEAGLEIFGLQLKSGLTMRLTDDLLGGAGIVMLQDIPCQTKTLKAPSREADAILLAAIGSPQYDDAPVRPEQGAFWPTRKELNLYANIRPVKIFRESQAFVTSEARTNNWC